MAHMRTGSMVALPIIGIAVLLLGSSCNNDSNSAGQDGSKTRDASKADSSPPQESPALDWATLQPSMLPEQVSAGMCNGEPVLDPLDACEWALSVDTVLLGSIVAVSPVDSPIRLECAVPPEQRYIAADECDGAVGHALDIELSVLEVLAGRDLGESVTVRIGKGELDSWQPAPGIAEDGSLNWAVEPDNSSSPLEPGTTLGVALRFDDYWNMWLIMGERLMTVEGEALKFQQGQGDCRPAHPSALDGQPAEVVRAALGACGNAERAVIEEAASRRARFESVGGEQRSVYVAATCIPRACPGENEPDGEPCDNNEDCSAGARCQEGICQ